MKSKTFIQSALVICAFLFTSLLYAQPHTMKGERGQNNKLDRVEILKNRLMMDDQTYMKFKPIYAKYNEELKSVIEKSKSKLKRDNRSISALNDEELDQITFAVVERNLDIATVNSKYLKEFKKVLNSRQLHTLYRLEIRNNNHKGMYAKRDRGARLELKKGEGRGFRYDNKKGDLSRKGGNLNWNDTIQIEKQINQKPAEK